MARYLYSELATAIQARRNCAEKRNSEWFDKWSERIEAIQEELPSGSGIDSGTRIDLDASHAGKLVLHTDYHHMNDGGMYDGWTEHTITVTPSFSGIDLRISGRNRNDIKEYLHDVYYSALTATLPWSFEDWKAVPLAELAKRAELHLAGFIQLVTPPISDLVEVPPNAEYFERYWAPEQARVIAESLKHNLARKAEVQS